jgi:hypothetical protein
MTNILNTDAQKPNKRTKGQAMVYNDEILINHRSFMTSINIPSGKESEDLPYLYWIPKLQSWKIKGFEGGYLRERSWFQVIQKIFRVFQNTHVIYATTRVNSFTIFLLFLFYTIHKAFSHRNYGSTFVVLGYNSTYFSNKIQKGKTCYSEEQVISMLELSNFRYKSKNDADEAVSWSL